MKLEIKDKGFKLKFDETTIEGEGFKSDFEAQQAGLKEMELLLKGIRKCTVKEHKIK